MLFDKEFIEWIKENPILGLVRACELAITKQNEVSLSSGWSEAEHAILWEASSFISLVAENNEIPLPFELPEPTKSMETNCNLLNQYIEHVRESLEDQAIILKINNYKNTYQALFKTPLPTNFLKVI